MALLIDILEWIKAPLIITARNSSKPNNVRKTSIIVSFGTNPLDTYLVFCVSFIILSEIKQKF